MPLLEVQTVLARLYTDSDFRRRFFESPASACAAFSLAPDDLKQLEKLDRNQIDRFAKSLLNKRVSLVREQLPALVIALGTSFGPLFTTYCEQHPSVPEPAEDCQQYLAFLSETPPKSPGFISALVRLELLRYELLEADRIELPRQPVWRPRISSRARIALFGYDMESIYAALLKGELPQPERERCTILIGNVSGQIRLRRLNEATTRLLKLCDGTRTVEEITEQVAEPLSLVGAERLRFAAETTRFLTTLAECRLID